MIEILTNNLPHTVLLRFNVTCFQNSSGEFRTRCIENFCITNTTKDVLFICKYNPQELDYVFSNNAY